MHQQWLPEVPENLLPSTPQLQQGNVFTCVCHSVNRGCLADTPLAWHPLPRADMVRPPWADTLLGRHPPGQTPWEEHLGRHLSPPSPVTATAADGTHSTGMHSCSQLLSDFKEFWRNFTLRLRNIIFSGFASFCHNFPVDTPNNLLFSREGRNTDVAKPACWWWV